MVSFARADRTRGDTIFKLKIEGQTGVSVLRTPFPFQLFDFKPSFKPFLHSLIIIFFDKKTKIIHSLDRLITILNLQRNLLFIYFSLTKDRKLDF